MSWHPLLRRTPLLFLLATLHACDCASDEGSETGKPDAGGATADAGPSVLDQGPSPGDSGPTEPDLGLQPDGGSPEDLGPDGGPAQPETFVVFGDLHTHTAYSLDAFNAMFYGLAGEQRELDRARDPAEACDFARYCAGLDFYGNSDHAEFITPEMWRRTQNMVRGCNLAVADDEYAEFVAFAGFEWTQSGQGGLPVYGHKNVFFAGLHEHDLPARTISSYDWVESDDTGPAAFRAYVTTLASHIDHDPMDEYVHLYDLDVCDSQTPSPELPLDCYEHADRPGELFRKLREWDLDALVIPHGTCWAVSPTDWAEQIDPVNHDPRFQRLVEVFSQHGSSEQYKEWQPRWGWRDPATDADCAPGPACATDRDCGLGRECMQGHCELDGCQWLCLPPPQEQPMLPCCWRAVQLTQQRPVCADVQSAACQAAVLRARKTGDVAVPRDDDDWLDCDQCADCFQPASGYFPTGSVQAALARTGFGGEQQTHLRLGFVGSTDNHRAAPGSVKETRESAEIAVADPGAVVQRGMGGNPVGRGEQAGSYWFAGGLVAAHVREQTRAAVWDALSRREVYGTSGDRILLWFWLEDDGVQHAMGSEVHVSSAPTFRVRALGAYPQQAGCPAALRTRFGDAFVDEVCSGMCYWPDTEQPRRRITDVEVVRIRRQQRPDQGLAELISDASEPWQRIPCGPATGEDGACEVTFQDPGFQLDGETVYYVRALQEPTPTVNGDPVRCSRDESGDCIASVPCPTRDHDDECLSLAAERAWSSPIYVNGP